MPLCGFTPTMLRGLTMFAQGLYQQALTRSREEDISLEDAFTKEVDAMKTFLTALDEMYYNDLKPRLSVDVAMRELIEWTKDKLATVP